MERIEIVKKIESSLKDFSRDKILYFSWISAIRTIPFMALNGSFCFWANQHIQKNIYMLFYSLDIDYLLTNALREYNGPILKTYKNISEKNLTNMMRVALSTRMYSQNDKINNLLFNSTNAALNVANTAVVVVDEREPIDSAIKVATDATMEIINAYNEVALDFEIADFEKIIFSDIEKIGNNEMPVYTNPDLIYSEIWKKFQEALAKIKCEYWGRCYKTIFDKHFVLDMDILSNRLNIPPEIEAEGASNVARYLQKLEKNGATRLNEARIIILGDKGAGKTSLARRLINSLAPMPTQEESTEGIDNTIWKIGKMNVHIWDFAGHAITHAVHQLFLSERCLYILVFNSRFEYRNLPEYWLDYVKNYGGSSHIIILINEHDKNPIDISYKRLKMKYNIDNKFSFSIRDDQDKLSKFKDYISTYIENNPSWSNQKMPIEYYLVKNDLTNMFSSNDLKQRKDYISKSIFDDIALKRQVSDPKSVYCPFIPLVHLELK